MAGAGTSQEQLLCPECGQIFHDESELLAHVLNHPEEGKFSCELCEEKFYHEGQLFEHSIAHKRDILDVSKPGKNVEEKALLIEDENCKKGAGMIKNCKKSTGIIKNCMKSTGIINLCVQKQKADHQLLEHFGDDEELEASVTSGGISYQVKAITINAGDKSSTEKENDFQLHTTSFKSELSFAANNAFREGKHSEHYSTEANIKDSQTENLPSKKNFITRQDVQLAASGQKCNDNRFLPKTAKKVLETPSDASERTSLKIVRKMLPKRVTLMSGKQIEEKYQIEAHVANHSDDVSYICGICYEQFNEKTKLKKHFSTHTKEECQIYTSSMEVLKKCVKIGPFNCKTRQISLSEKHRESTPYLCQICSKRFKDKQQLAKHSMMHTKNKHLCRTCFESFKTRRQLIAHSATHETKTECQFACQVCSEQYPTEKQLQKHFYTHTDITHMCQVCDKVFAHWRYLRNHMAYHTRPHVCNVCGEGFPAKSFLRLHKFGHNQEEQMQSVSNTFSDESRLFRSAGVLLRGRRRQGSGVQPRPHGWGDPSGQRPNRRLRRREVRAAAEREGRLRHQVQAES